MSLPTLGVRLPAALLAAAVFVSVPPAGAAPDAAEAPDAAVADEPVLIQFNFKGATFDQVIDFFSRMTGLPVVREADVPQGTLDYLAPEAYTLAEALDILNIILHSKGVALRVNDDMLYLQKLENMQQEDIPVFVGELPAEVGDNEIITVVRPLTMAMAKPLAERLASMVASYGSVTAMEQQNSLVITETAGQVRRLLTIVETLDLEDPEGMVEFFTLKHAKAEDLMTSLKALLSQKVIKYVVDQKGKQVKVEEETMPGVTLSADARTNSIIAKGVQSRLDKLREAIALLDVPAVGEGRSLRTFNLVRLAPQEASAKLNQLYAKIPEAERPTVLALDDVGKITVVGTATDITEASALLAEIDGGESMSLDPERSIAVIALAHAEPQAVAAAAGSLLNGRQLVTLKMVPGPDRRSLIVAGTTTDVEAARALVPVLDQPPHVDRTVRLVRLTTSDPQQTADRARELYLRQVDADDPRWALAVELDPASRVLTVVGAEAAQGRFAEALRMVEDHAVVDRETRQIKVVNAQPTRIVAPLTALGRQMLEPHDGSQYVPPEIEPVDPLDLLVVTAQPGQFTVLESLVTTLDRPGPGDFQLRVVQLTGIEPAALIEKADFVYERLVQGFDPVDYPAPAVEFDKLTGNLLITGRADSVRLYESAVGEARRLVPPGRSGRMIEVRDARAADVIGPLRELLATTAPVDPARTVPEPTIELVERTNSLYIVAESAQHQMIERSVRLLDRYEPSELPPMQLLQVRAADALQISGMLRKRYDARPAEQRREQPVEIDADAGTNTLIVTAHVDVFDEIKSFVDTINRSGEAERETMIFSLNRARAADLAQALDRLYPRPPMPLDRRGRPMPHLQEPKEVHVSADPATNTLIVEAPAERRAQFEALVEQLDRVQLPPKAELRTYHIERGDPNQIARTLNDLARQGVMSETPPDGRQPVQVTVMAEPVSRTLIVAGDEVTFAKTEEVLTDLQAVPIKRSLRVIEVTGTNPQEMADRAQRLYQEQTADIPDAHEVSVEVDVDNSTLLVVADDEAMMRFVTILNELQDSIGPPPDVELMALEFQSAEAAVEFLDDLASNALAMMGSRMGSPPVFAAIERTNSVLIGAQRDQQAIIRSLLQSFDKPDVQEMPPLRILQLRTADADNLARALMRQYDRRRPEERQERPVSITSDPNTNALIVAAHPDMLPEIADVVDELNETELYGEEGREIRIFPLRVARAEELARTIDEMFPQPPVPRDRRGRAMYHLQQPREVVVRADPQTNALIVDAPIKRMVGFDKLVEQLDRQQIIAESEVRTYRIVHADINAIRATLQQLAVGGGLSPAGRDQRIPTSINVEPVSRSLVVSGPSDIFERVEQVLADLDAKRAAPATSLRFFKLTNARAETLVPMLREILLRRLDEDVEGVGPDAAALLNISADRKTNTLIISAPPEILPVADALIEELDHPRAAVEAVDVRIFQLTQADAGQVATAVRQAVEARARADGEPPEATISPEPSSNSIVVTAPAREVVRIEALIESLDGAPPADRVQVRTVFLEHARAERLAPIISELLAREELLDVNRLPSWQRMQFLSFQMRQGGFEPTVRVAADTKLNAIVISAPPALLNVAEQMVTQLDVDPTDIGAAGLRSVRVLVVENADAAQLASNLEAIFEAEGPEAAPTIRVDSPSNSLLVVATDAQYETIENVVKQIDRATIATSRQMRMIPLDPSKASARELARTLQRIIGRRGGEGVQVITIDELLQRRETRENPLREKRKRDPTSALPVPLFDVIAATAFAVTDDAPSDEEASDEPQEPGVTIAVDPETNSLIIVGSPRSIERVADLTRQLLTQIPAAPGRIRYIGLPEGVDARTAASLISQTIAQMTPPAGRRGDLRRRVAIVADQTNNALIVTCNESDFEVVGDLIAALSQPTTTEQIVVKVYNLQTITADRAAESVRRMLDPDAARAPRRGRQAQRMRDLAVKLLVDDQEIEAVFNPDRVRVTSDSQNNAVIVMGPPEAIAFVDEFIELLDQTPVNVQTTMKLYPLQHAKADQLRNTLRNIFRVRYWSLRGQPGASAIQPEFAFDDRTNTLLVTAAPEQLGEIDALLKDLDRPLGDERHPLRTIELTAVGAQQAAGILERVVIGTDQKRRSSTMIVADDATGVLLVRAPEDVMTEIDEVLAEVDRPSTREFKVRTIVLEAANADIVASALQKLYDDRARIASAGRGRRAQSRRVSIIGDRNSNMLLVAASDEDFAGIQELVKKFDSPEAAQALGFRVFTLKHAKAADIAQTVQQLAWQIMFSEEGPGAFWWGSRGQQRERSRSGVLAVQADTRLNALIVTGEGDKFEVVEQLIAVLDAPEPAGERRTVKLYRVEHADVNVVTDVLNETFAFGTRYRRWWQEPDPTEVRIRTDRRNKIIIVYGTAKQQEEIGAFIEGIDQQTATPNQQFAVLPVEFAQARELANTLNQFMRNRAQVTGAPAPTATIVASQSANTLVVSAGEEDLATIRDLLTRIDQPNVSADRTIEIIVLADGNADEIARIVRQQFGRRGGAGVIVTPDARTNSIIVNAPQLQFEQARALIERLDAPPHSDETIIRTYALEGARAEEVVRILGQTLQLDDRGETKGITIRLEGEEGEAVEVKAKIVADRRSNSVIVTATEESFPVIEKLIAGIDEVPASSPVEYRIIPLEHALAIDVFYTLGSFLRERDLGPGEPQPNIDYNRLENQLIIAATADQFEQIKRIVEELDQPSRKARTTDFVPLRFAQAEQVQEALSVFYGPLALEADTPGKLNARIVADPATNSLVITADESEWANIRQLLAKLDSEEYDISLQLKVIPLTYADARSVAQAINSAFSTELQRRRRPDERGTRRPTRDPDRREEGDYPTVLVESEEWVRASAETLTNSVIVSASRTNIRKIEQIVTQLDVADYAKLPPPQIIPVRTGSPRQLAESLRRLYEQQGGDQRSGRALRIVGDDASNTIIVRAEAEDFVQIQALAEALQDEASAQGLSVYVLKMRSAPARRVGDAIRQAFATKARQAGQPLAVNVDVQGNSLVIACTAQLFGEIRDTIEQLDDLAPAAGQGIFIIELQNISPDAARRVIETIGLHEPPSDDSVSRIVTEPVRVVPLTGRNAIIVVANPADRDTIVGLLKAVDAEPELAEARVRVVRLHNAQAQAVAGILQQILSPAQQQVGTALAHAVREQIRRLSVRRDGLQDGDLDLDLTKPVRIIADTSLNALVISSTPENVEVLVEIVAMFDELPITDGVTVQLFPLANIAADQFARIVRELFAQGKRLGGVPGTNLDAVPGGMAGRALLDEVAISIDLRTNTVIVAGKQDAVALVEVLYRRIDSEVATGWVEPRIVELRFADAQDLAETLNAILVEGATNRAQSSPLQRQVARLRMARLDENGGRVLESDVYAPMIRLVIRPEPKINALVLVGTPMNLEVVIELIAMLDVESAAPEGLVRIYPIEHATAARLAPTINRLFAQQVQTGALRREDRVIVQVDERTNALVVSTTPRSFAVLEPLLETLDAEVAPELQAIKRVELVNSTASRIAPMIQQLVDARLERMREVEPETADLERATIIADTRTNSLIIAAGHESFKAIQRLVTDLDRGSLDEDALIRVIAVTTGNLERIAETVDAVMERRYADMPSEIRRSQQPLVMIDPRSNSLVVAANPADVEAIEQLVARLDAAPINPAIRLEVIPLDTTQANLLAPRLQSLMRQRQQALGREAMPSDRVTIEPDTASNSLIVAASDDNIQVIRDLITALVRAESEVVGDAEIELIQLVSSRADDVVDLLDDLYVDQANRDRGRDTVQVTADERLNAVVVNAPPADVEAIKSLVARLDGARPATVVEIKYIPLTSANSLETVSLIENVLSGRGLGSRRSTEQAIVLKYLQEFAERIDGETGERLTEVQVSSAIRESISLTPDLRTNSVIVSAPREAMDLIVRMIQDMDETTSGSKNIRIFHLENADALAMAEILTDLFNLTQQGNLYVLKPRERQVAPAPAPGAELPPGVAPYAGLFGTELTAVPDERQQLFITVDSRTNSLLVSGTPIYLDLVDEVVTQLDALEANERDVYVYPLRNAVATEVASVITSFVEAEQQKLISTLSPDQIGAAARLLEREVTIVGDEKSNTVLVSASPRYMDRVQQMINELDVDPPQVLIQVLLAEITIDTGLEWGFDTRVEAGPYGGDNVFLRGASSLASAFLPTLGIPAFSVSSDDFTLMLKALQSQGRLQVLSNPSVMAANNQPAHIQVGENIGRASAQSITDGGNQQTVVEFEDIGVILDVTPSINPDGFVRMEIMPSIIDLTNREIQITEDLAVPVLTKREATTTVTVRDGQTIVLGGLISDEYEERKWKIPILGDIPLIGLIFRSEQKDRKKIELLIVLTPHVITSPAEEARVRYITEQEIQRLSVDEEEKDRLREARVIPEGMQEEEPIPSVSEEGETPPEDTPAAEEADEAQTDEKTEKKTAPEGPQEPQDANPVDEAG